MQLFGFLRPAVGFVLGYVLTNSWLKAHHHPPHVVALHPLALPAPTVPSAGRPLVLVLMPVPVPVQGPKSAKVLLAVPAAAVL